MHQLELKGRVTNFEVGSRCLWNCFSTEEEIIYLLTFAQLFRRLL